MADENNSIITDENIAKVRDLLESMEKGELVDSKEILDELTQIRESDLYNEMGKLTRELHDAIQNFGLDDQIVNLAEEEIPDARSRLHHVIHMTDQAANRTLGAVEESIPLCEGLEKRSSELHQQWQRFRQRDMDVTEFRELSTKLGRFFEENTADAGKIHASLNDVLMAQDFQDLTSQIIKRVIGLVEDVESNLVNLITLAGTMPNAPGADKEKDKKEGLAGPVVPGVNTEDTVSGQDEVDDLLSSLGF